MLSGCSSASEFPDALDHAVATSDGALSLEGLLDAGVDHYLVVCPYESASSVRERIGFEWDEAPDLSGTDSVQVVVQLNKGRVAEPRRLARTPVDFCRGSEAWQVLPIAAILPVSAGDDGSWSIAPAQ